MNEKITDFQGVVAHIDRNNIDTDQIIPTEYLKSIKKYGYEDYLFDGWRYSDTGPYHYISIRRISNLHIHIF